MSEGVSIKTLVAGLGSDDSRATYRCLVALRTQFIKEKDGVALLRQHGGLEGLLDILKHHKDKILNITLSILGNCCLEDETRIKILDLCGISVLGDVFLRATDASICNRSCRTLANLALERRCCDGVHELGTTLPHIARTLTGLTDPDCQQTYLRALRLLADTAEHRIAVIASDGLKSVCTVLKDSSSETILSATLKTLTTLTTEFSDDCVQQLLSTDVLQRLVELLSEPSAVRSPALSLLLSFSPRPELRPALGSVGIIGVLLAAVLAGADDGLPLVNALCHFCQEAVNRVRVRDAGVLQCMLEWLGSERYRRIHNRIISALVCFLYDEPSMDLLLACGLVPVLVQHLHRCMMLSLAAGPAASASGHGCAAPEPAGETGEQDRAEKGSASESTQTGCSAGECVAARDMLQTGEVDESQQKLGAGSLAEGGGAATMKDKEQPGGSCGAVKQTDENRINDSEKIEDLDDVRISDNTIEQSHMARTANLDMQLDVDLNELLDTIDKGSKCDHLKVEERKSPGDVKYSIDSPTYKAFADVSYGDAYSGPKNIMESAEYYGHASPHGLYGYRSPPRYSPLSTMSYPSPEWSPESSPLRSLSPVGLDLQFSPCLPSTSGGGASPQNDASSPLHWSHSDPMISREVEPLEWSPVHATDHFALEFAASDFAQSPKELVSCTLPKFCLEENADAFNVENDLVPLTDADVLTQAYPDNQFVPVHDEWTSPVVDVSDSSTDQISLTGSDDVTSGNSAGGGAGHKHGLKLHGRRKRSFSAQTMSKIRKIVAASPSHSTVDLCELMSPIVVEQHGRRRYDRHQDPAKMTEHNILVLLSRVSYMTDPSTYLVSEGTLRGLLDYVARANRPLSRAARVLRRLTRNTHCFEPIIMHMMPMLIDTLLSQQDHAPLGETPAAAVCSDVLACADVDQGDECNSGQQTDGDAKSITPAADRDPHHSSPTRYNDTRELKRCLLTNLSLLSESRYGRGVISHILLTGSIKVKHRCAISLPFLCRSRELRRKMLLEFSGLELLLKSFTVSTADTFPMAVNSLSNLFTSLSIKSHEPISMTRQLMKISSEEGVTTRSSVTFVFDDGSRITALRELLVRHSSVFAAMLDGHYCECVQEEVRINAVNPTAFHLLVNFLQHECDTHETVDEIVFSTCHKTEPMEVCMDVLALTNQYLVPQLQQHISRLLCEHYLTEDTVCLLLQFALLHNSIWLAQRCVCFFFIQPMAHTTRLAIATTLMDGAQSHDIRQTMHSMIVSNIM